MSPIRRGDGTPSSEEDGAFEVDTSSQVRQRRNRNITKCDRCRMRKQRCNSLLPCATCRAYGVECKYTVGKPLGFYEEIMDASPAELAEVQSGLLRLEELLKYHFASTGSSSGWPSDSSAAISLPPGVQQPPQQSVDLDVDDIGSQIASLWLQPDVEISYRNPHPLLLELRKNFGTIRDGSNSSSTGSTSSKASSKKPKEPFVLDGTDATLFSHIPHEYQARQLLRVYFDQCNYFFELHNEADIFESARLLYSSLASSPGRPLSAAQWTQFSNLIAICRLSLAFISEKEAVDWRLTERYTRPVLIDGWCDVATLVLDKAKFCAEPTVEGQKALLTLLMTMYFEKEHGAIGGTKRSKELRYLATQAAFAMNLYHDPGDSVESLEANDRRRSWWTLVCIDSHYGLSTHAQLIQIEMADTKIPRSPSTGKYPGVGHILYDNDPTTRLDLRSSEARIILGKFTNRICRLLAQRMPLPTAVDVERLDSELAGWQQRVLEEQQIAINPDSIEIPPDRDMPLELRMGQFLFYTSMNYLRARLNRPLHTPGQANAAACDTARHRNIVVGCSLRLLRLYKVSQATTAFAVAIVSCALSLFLDVYTQPNSEEAPLIRKQIEPFLDQLKDCKSPILTRALLILEHLRPAVLATPMLTSTADLADSLEYQNWSRAALFSGPAFQERSRPASGTLQHASIDRQAPAHFVGHDFYPQADDLVMPATSSFAHVGGQALVDDPFDLSEPIFGGSEDGQYSW